MRTTVRSTLHRHSHECLTVEYLYQSQRTVNVSSQSSHWQRQKYPKTSILIAWTPGKDLQQQTGCTHKGQKEGILEEYVAFLHGSTSLLYLRDDPILHGLKKWQEENRLEITSDWQVKTPRDNEYSSGRN